MLKNQVGKRIKEQRLSKGLSQDDLASLALIERNQLAKIETGKINPTDEIIEKISKALNIKTSFLEEKSIIHPFVKWAGGKTQLLSKLYEFMPENFNNYFEPFVGGGSFFMSLAPKEAVINDYNTELILAYRCFQSDELFDLLIKELKIHEANHSEEYYYKVRELDRKDDFESLPIYKRAARMIYLNKACFNGLYRVNSKGFFNVPSGRKSKVVTFDEENFRNLHNYFKNNNITILNGDYQKAVDGATSGDFVYLDPPYDTIEDKNSFTSYNKIDFGKDEQIRLSDVFKNLNSKGVLVMLSNHNTPFIRELYKEFNIHVVNAKRMINSKADGRGNVEEVIITNY